MLPNTPVSTQQNGREDGLNHGSTLTAGMAKMNLQQHGNSNGSPMQQQQQPPGGYGNFRPQQPQQPVNGSSYPQSGGPRPMAPPAMPRLPQFATTSNSNSQFQAGQGPPGVNSYPRPPMESGNVSQPHGTALQQGSAVAQARLPQPSNQMPAFHTGPGQTFPAQNNLQAQNHGHVQQQHQVANMPNPSYPGGQPGQPPLQQPVSLGHAQPGHTMAQQPAASQPGQQAYPPQHTAQGFPGAGQAPTPLQQHQVSSSSFPAGGYNPAFPPPAANQASAPRPALPQLQQQAGQQQTTFPGQYPPGGAGYSPGMPPASAGPAPAGPYYPQPPQNAMQMPGGQYPPQQQQQQQHIGPPGQYPSQPRPPFPGSAPGGVSNGYPPNMSAIQPGMSQPGMMNMHAPPGPQFPGSAPPGGPGGVPQLGPDGRSLTMDPNAMKRAAPQLTNEILPSVIDVLERDRQFNSGVYESRLNPTLPPLVSSASRSVDCGNSVPELLRSSLYVAPCTANLLKDSGLPFVLHMQPMAELPVDAPPIPIVDHGPKGPVRCTRCKAYMSPYMKFVEGGKKFQCPFCLVSTEVPQEYFAYLDSEGRRVDISQRAELCLGTYEFLATKEYCRNEKLPEAPAFIFMIDVSYRAVSSGMVAQVCQMLRTELESLLPVEANGQESKLRVGIATFSDSVHFFNLKASLKQPSMMTVNDFSEMFVPLVDGFLVRLEESGQMFDRLLQEIPKIFADARQVDTILHPVIQAGMRALEAAACPGKLFVFNFSLPVFDAPGKLKNRDNREVLGTDKEKTLLKPQVADYTELAKECVSVGCSVDLFLFPNSYIDVATLSEVTRLTGGQTYKYAYFTAEKDGNRFLWDLRRNLKRSIAFDAVMRVRTSAGIRPTDYFGNLSMPTTTEVHLASLDSDKVILAEIRHDDKLEERSIVHIQVALLYTSLSAQRRVRLLNMALMSSGDYAELFRTAEIDVIMNFMMKNSVKGLYEFSPAAIREGLTERSTKMLSAYRNHCSPKTQGGQLVLPETLKLLPIYTGCLIRNDIISGLGSEVGADDRSWLINHVNSLSIDHSTTFLYPRLFVLTEFDEASTDSPRQNSFRQVRSTSQNMRTNQAYLLENGVAMFMWLGSDVDPGWVGDVFGVASVAQVDIDKGDAALSTRSSPIADQLRRFINMTRNSRPVYMRLMITRQGDKMEGWFRRFLVEDQGTTSFQLSYVQYIYYLHNAIRDEVDK